MIKIVEDKNSHKIGMEEIVGLEMAMRDAFKPIETLIRDLAYWESENKHLVDTAEYKRRDGFIPHGDNFGGLQIRMIVPKCEQGCFDILEFGECNQCGDATEYPKGDHQCGYEGIECSLQSDGYLDAGLRIWFKFEGIEDGTLKFYLYAGGGGGDAPYFRTKAEADLFEASFECKSVAGVKRAATKHIKALLKVLGK